MEKANIEYLLNIFKELTTEMPQEMIWREDGDSIELRSLGDSTVQDFGGDNWNLISSRLFEVA